MKSLFANYFMEREGIQTVENENSFFTFELDYKKLGIPDLYIKPSKRNSYEYLKIIRQIINIADVMDSKEIYGKVYKKTYNHEFILNMHKKTGFKAIREDEDFIFLKANIEVLERFR